MKTLVFSIALILLNYLTGMFLPWWTLAIVAGVLGYIAKFSNLKSFWVAFLSILIFWFLYLLFIDSGNDSILSAKIAKLFTLPSKYLGFLLSAVMGALVAGFSAATGSSVYHILNVKKSEDPLKTEMDLNEMQEIRPDLKNTQHL